MIQYSKDKHHLCTCQDCWEAVQDMLRLHYRMELKNHGTFVDELNVCKVPVTSEDALVATALAPIPTVFDSSGISSTKDTVSPVTP